MSADPRSLPVEDEANHPRTGLRLIGRGLRRHARRLTIGYALMIAWQMSETLVPVVIGLVVDRAVDGGGWSDLAWSLGVMVALFVVLANGYRFGSRFVVRSVELESHHLRLEISGHVLHPRGARTASLTGETLSLATTDARQAPQVMRQLGYALASLVAVVFVAIYVLRLDLVLGLLVVLGVPGVLVLIQVLAPMVARRTAHQQARTATAAGLAADLLQGLRPLKGIGGEDVALRRYRAASQDASIATVGVAGASGLLAGLTAALSGLLLAVVALVAGRRALAGEISLGELIAVVGLVQFIGEPLRGLGEVTAQFAASRASAGRIVTFLQAPRLTHAGPEDLAERTVPVLELRAVDAPPVSRLDLRVDPGRLVVVSADDPATLDVLVRLLGAEQVPHAGRVLLDGVELTALTTAARRRHVVVAEHHTEIFEGTLRTTVDPLGVHSDDALRPYLEASAADEVVALHPDGLDRAVRSGGASLSGGQRQRLALARALATDTSVLVLHDPTSAVDAVTEHAVAEQVHRVRAGRTTLVLTSNPAWLQQADEVVVVRDGIVAASGRHRDLLADARYLEAVVR